MPHEASRPIRLSAPTVVARLVVMVVIVATGLAGAPAPVRAADPSASPSPTPVRPRAPVATLAPIPTGALTTGATATPAPTATVPTTLGASVTFYGRGYGHGVGMSQYGAKGRAAGGQTANQILDHYYQGTTPGTIALGTPIRVRVLKAFAATTAAPLVLYGRNGGWTIDGVAATYPKDARATVTPTTSGGVTSWRLKVVSATGTVLRDAGTTGFRMRPAADVTTLQVWSRPSTYDEYRGVIRVRLGTTGPTADVVNELPLETYLRGVVPAEMPSTWPTAAVQAQAIAARSYAARRLRPGTSWYDVSDDTTSQVYRGKEGEKAATDAAIAATAGVVRMSGSTIANTLFHSAGGGATEDNENVFVSSSGAKVAGPVSYLRGSLDRRPDGSPYDGDSPYATWKTATYTRTRLSAWFADDPRTAVGSLTALVLRDRGVSGRLISVTLIGSAGTKKVSGNVFRAVFNAHRPTGDPMMRSTLVDTKPVP